MSRVKKKRPHSGFFRTGKQSPITPCITGKRASKEENSKYRPKHTYSTRTHEYLKRRLPKSHKAAAPGVLASSPSRSGAELPVTPNCAALPALIITPCRTRSASPISRRYHHSCTPSPNPHTPRTGHTPQRDFDSQALRYLAAKAIRYKKKYAEERSLGREREQCRRHSCSPPPLQTRHKHYCGQKPYKRNRTVFQMVSNALEKGFDAFRSLIEDGPIGDSARYCRRRFKRLLRPIWCNCLRHTCLGPPADRIQRHVLTRGRKPRPRAGSPEVMKKFPPIPTPIPPSPEHLGLDESKSDPCTTATTKEASTYQVAAVASLEQQPPPEKAVSSLLKLNELSPAVHEQVFGGKQQLQQDPETGKGSSQKPSTNKSRKTPPSAKQQSSRANTKQKRTNVVKTS